ncbi:MAG: hypothetical protein K8T10_17895 [Candidatus Eremiobacteraeota bacterium]|nr:hypothetical protein [Candidatus Eremiobacteraeota bacterium]
MSFWNDVIIKLKQKTTASDITNDVYKKLASSRVNMLALIKPSFYIGQMSILTMDYMGYVEKFLSADDGDWGEYLKFILYIRESSKRLLFNTQNLHGPLDTLIRTLEEVLEGEKFLGEDEYEEEPEPEALEEPENVDLEDILEENKDTGEEVEEISISREEMSSDYEALKEALRVKLRQADVPEKVYRELANEIADVYQECVQLAKEVYRLSNFPDGDISTLLSILVDIQYGLCYEMKRHLLEDVIVEDSFQFNPGLLTWTAHFLAKFSEKINKEMKTEINIR